MTEKPVYPKTTCCIAGCPRWSRRYPGEWICGRHWKLIRKSRRKALRALWAAGPMTRAMYRREARLWVASKREATLKAAGI